MLTKNYTLSNNVKMPMVGFGTFKLQPGDEAKKAVRNALNLGYRHIDCAMIYGNEESVGQGIKASGIPRQDMFITSKVWNTDHGYERTQTAFYETLDRLKLDYLDLYLIHWPKPINAETWKAMEELYEQRKIRAIGVCNFNQHHLEDLLSHCKIEPMVNQIELHPKFTQPELCQYCSDHNIQVEAWGSLMQGQIFEIPLLKQLADKYEKTVAQIALKWALQKGYAVIPKTVSTEKMKSNLKLADFNISDADMAQIATLDCGGRIGPDPDNFDF